MQSTFDGGVVGEMGGCVFLGGCGCGEGGWRIEWG